MLLLHGPVGSSKSTLARLLKRGLERYSKTEAGAMYSYGWKEPDGSIAWCPMHEEPLKLIPQEQWHGGPLNVTCFIIEVYSQRNIHNLKTAGHCISCL